MLTLWRKRAKRERRPEADAGEEFGFDARMDAILDDVRAEADRILDDARRRAAGAGGGVDERLSDRRQRLLELSDQLIARGESVLAQLDDAEEARRSLERMLRALSQAADEISFELAASPLGPRPEAGAASAPADADAGDGREAAIQMAAAGATRSQVDAHLREFTEVGDPTELLDQVFGSMSPADARVPWAIRRDG